MTSEPEDLAEVLGDVGELASGADGIIGGLDRRQRISLLADISNEFGWLLPDELGEATGLDLDKLAMLTEQRLLFGMSLGEVTAYPGFMVSNGQPAFVLAASIAPLYQVFSDWELLAWLVSANGHLNGRRPIDVSVIALRNAVDAELRQAGVENLAGVPVLRDGPPPARDADHAGDYLVIRIGMDEKVDIWARDKVQLTDLGDLLCALGDDFRAGNVRRLS